MLLWVHSVIRPQIGIMNFIQEENKGTNLWRRERGGRTFYCFIFCAYYTVVLYLNTCDHALHNIPGLCKHSPTDIHQTYLFSYYLIFHYFSFYRCRRLPCWRTGFCLKKGRVMISITLSFHKKDFCETVYQRSFFFGKCHPNMGDFLQSIFSVADLCWRKWRRRRLFLTCANKCLH